MFIAMLMVPILALVHGFGLIAMSHMFNLTDEALLHQKLSPKSIFLVAFVAVLLFALHTVEIAMVGTLYELGGATKSLEQSMVLSAS